MSEPTATEATDSSARRPLRIVLLLNRDCTSARKPSMTWRPVGAKPELLAQA